MLFYAFDAKNAQKKSYSSQNTATKQNDKDNRLIKRRIEHYLNILLRRVGFFAPDNENIKLEMLPLIQTSQLSRSSLVTSRLEPVITTVLVSVSTTA